MRRAGRWVKSWPEAKKIVNKEILIRDSTLEKTFATIFSFFHLKLKHKQAILQGRHGFTLINVSIVELM